MNSAAFLVVSETVKAWPAFLPSIPEARKIDPSSPEARDIRLGYTLAISWSLVVLFYATSQTKSDLPLYLWLLCAMGMTGMYEFALRSGTP